MTQTRPTTTDSSSDTTEVEALVDEWGEHAFPASDPPGRLPPSLEQEQTDPERDGV